MTTIPELLSELQPSDRTLVYLASGPNIRESYQSLEFDHVILVDKGLANTGRQGRVVSIRSECAEFLTACLRANVKFDAVVILNEGRNEGGWLYPLHADWFLGLLIAATRDDYVHVACPGYYRRVECWHLANAKKFLDIPFSKTELSAGDEGFLDPRHFSDDVPESMVWSMQRTKRCHTFQLGLVHCSVRQQSVWENCDDYDLIVLPAPFRPEAIRGKPLPTSARIKTIRAARTPEDGSPAPDFDNIEDVLRFCNETVSHVAILPWLLGQYGDVKNAIQRLHQPDLKIDFYHLNKSDFTKFYECD